MKKIPVLLMIVAMATACNNKSETTTTTATDSAAAAESPLMDAVNTADSVGKMIQDSSSQMMDTIHKK
ncbi:MAG: hypothetical protein ABIO79_08555 [Ferruginibacter sp.]